MLLEKDKLTGTFGNVSSLFFWTSSISSEKKHAKLVRKNKEDTRISFAQKCRSWHEEIVLASRVPSYGVVPGEAQFKKEAGLPS